MKLALTIRPSRVWISSISARPRPCAVPPSIWPIDRLRVERAADVLRRADPDDAGQAEVDVDLGDDPHRRRRKLHVGALAGDLAGFRVERRRARMAEDTLDVDLAAAEPRLLLERRTAGVTHGARRHLGHPRGGRRAGRADRGRRDRREGDVVGAELRPRDLEDDALDALADLGGGAVDDGAPVRPAAGRARRRSRRTPPSSRRS